MIHAHTRDDGEIDLCGANCPIEPSAPHVIVSAEIADKIVDALSKDKANAELRDYVWDLTIQARAQK